ncbi:MAG TPA: DNA replication/repair protein RecF [Bacteroidales bacterium]|nr:DNA replication/repair protein RecF [Bacteroidales bacterium]HPS73390.1 DNA replication/repair protein RecF [Bacteroidales bacterium]
MYLHKLTLSNFKSYDEAEFLFCDKINCFVGDNGVGKTNLLDAIHYLAFCKSYFTSVDTYNIRHGQDFFAIHGLWAHGDQSDLLQCVQKKGQRKKFLLNKKEYDRLADHIGMIPLVMISPYDRDLINDGSEIRRKYIDSVISQFDRIYLDDLINYNKALNQRNALLKLFAERQTFEPGSLDIWDEKLVLLGTLIHSKRRVFLEEFVPIFRKYYRIISGDSETVDIRYVSQLHERPMKELLDESLARDRMTQFTSAGTHKDDLDFMMGDFPVKRYGSQGQQKSFVVAVKLAQFDFTRNKKGFKPILLLDDVFDKLDDHRVEQLIKLVSEDNFGQVFITDTQEEKMNRIFSRIPISHKIFRIPGDEVR